ncbi:MAG: hypothetical protein M9921_08145 [Fimbriimonadaceae bacterium]|nr:hypothetical protein [Fimbriimonadaceae bacterium]
MVAARQAAGEDWPLSFALWIAERIVEEGDAEFHISNENDENPGTKRVDIDGDISDFVYGTFERLWHAAPVWVAYVGLALMLGFALSWYGIEAAIQAYMRANGLTVMRVRILLKLLAWAVLGLSGAFILCLPVRILLDAAARRRKR